MMAVMGVEATDSLGGQLITEHVYDGVDNLTLTTEKPVFGPPYWEGAIVIILSVTLSIVMVISIVGNSLIILSMVFFKGMRSKTNVFITNLACADLGVSVLCMPFSLVTVIQGDWMFGDVLCNINAFFEALFLVASTHGLMIIALHKFFSLVMPLRRIVNLRRAIFMIIFAWFVGLTCALPPIVGLSENVYKPGTSQCGPKYPEKLREKIAGLYVPLVGIVIPLICLIIAYGVIFNTIRKYSSRLRRHTSMTEDRIFRQQKRITVTLFIVFISFFICWTPYFVYSCLGFSVGFHDIPTMLNVAAYWSGYTNSALNPIIYAWRAKSYRKAFRKICCCSVKDGVITDTGTVNNGEFVSPSLHRRHLVLLGQHQASMHQGSASSSMSSILKITANPLRTPVHRHQPPSETNHNGIHLTELPRNGSIAKSHSNTAMMHSEDDVFTAEELSLASSRRRKSEADKDGLERSHYDLTTRPRDRIAYRSDPGTGRHQVEKLPSNGHIGPEVACNQNDNDWVPDLRARRALLGRSTIV